MGVISAFIMVGTEASTRAGVEPRDIRARDRPPSWVSIEQHGLIEGIGIALKRTSIVVGQEPPRDGRGKQVVADEWTAAQRGGEG